MNFEVIKEEKNTLEELRILSNVVQALENLITQCGNIKEFSNIQGFAETAHFHLQTVIRRKIHGKDGLE